MRATITTFATKLPVDLKIKLDEVCEKFGLKKTFVVESALREKLEDLLDTFDLLEAEAQASEFEDWEKVKKELNHKGKL